MFYIIEIINRKPLLSHFGYSESISSLLYGKLIKNEGNFNAALWSNEILRDCG